MENTPKELDILFIPWEQSGVGLYRLIIPALSLGDRKLANVTTLGSFSGDVRDMTKIDLGYLSQSIKLKSHNILYTTKPLTALHVALCQTIQEKAKAKWVLDMDDNILEVNKDNPGYQAFAKEGKGDQRFFVEEAMRQCDLLVTSTENLKEVYAKYNDNIYVSPNSIDFRFWKFDNAHGINGKVRIGWAGAGGHRFDLSLIKGAIQELKKEFKDKIQVVTFGGEKPDFSEEHHDWVGLREYPEKLASLGFDIGIAPLRDNLYNRGKSNLRWLEYSALKIPTVASDVLPFRNSTARLASDEQDWYTHLKELIIDKDKRLAEGQESFNNIKRRFNSSKNVRKLSDRLQELLCQKKLSAAAKKRQDKFLAKYKQASRAK